MSLTAQEARSIIRKAKKRVPQGEDISHLNIMPMLDIMTILLVFMIAQASVDATAISTTDLVTPDSLTRDKPTEQFTSVQIGQKAILVDGEPVVAVRDGDVDSSQRVGGAMGLEITKLSSRLRLHRKAFTAGNMTDEDRDKVLGNLTIIADRDTPYRLLVSVMYSARQACADEPDCYRRYRLIVTATGE